jgi:glycosyltransferase involved in cell wall biosynthesis
MSGDGPIPPTDERHLFVSVVIPAYNRASFVARCLAPLITQSYPRDRYEIILVDDGSTDGLADVARVFVGAWPGQFRLIQQPNGGPASARNTGIRASTADIIAFTDSDCVVSSDWLEHLAGALVRSDAAGVGGPIVDAAPPSWVAHYLASGNFYRHRVRGGQVDYLLTANVAFRRPALAAVGGFSEREGAWGEDADLSFRLRQAGHRLMLTDCGAVTHYGAPASVRGLVRDLYRYGRGSAVLSRNWTNGRTPGVELIRHAAAVELAPFIALARAPRVGLWRALSFWPLVEIEHSAFIAGLLSGLMGRLVRAVSSPGHGPSQRHQVRAGAGNRHKEMSGI